MIAPAVDPTILKFPTLDTPIGNLPFGQGEKVTLRLWYERCLLPEIRNEQAPRSLKEDRVALNRWEDCTANPDIRFVKRSDLETFRDGLIKRGCAPATINKYWRELRTIFRDAAEEELIKKPPVISRRGGAALIKIRKPKIHRATLTLDEVDRLYRACAHATYPANQRFSTPTLWQAAIVLFFTYGARTKDVLTQLEWSNVLWSDRLIKFAAMKTSKIQGLPMTDAVEWHLRSIQRDSGRVFDGFRTAGHRAKDGKWKRGISTTWRNEICRASGFVDVNFKLFRESMVTRYNGIEPNLGSWIAGHFVPGVSAQSYDLPTERIRAAIESAPVPSSFVRAS